MRKSLVASAAIHVAAVLLLFSLTIRLPDRPAARDRGRVVTLLRLPRFRRAEGGGGERAIPHASRGRPPAIVARKIWLPPQIVRNETPKLVVQQALLEVPEFNIRASVVGDPFGKPGPPSGGTGLLGGFGEGEGTGIGPGKGSRLGGDLIQPAIRITRGPQLLYKEEPEYSEEARKARFQGTVMLSIEVDPAGNPVNIRVVQGLGLGLDQRAIAAVARWRFRPALSGDRPVAVMAVIEVSFHLL